MLRKHKPAYIEGDTNDPDYCNVLVLGDPKNPSKQRKFCWMNGFDASMLALVERLAEDGVEEKRFSRRVADLMKSQIRTYIKNR